MGGITLVPTTPGRQLFADNLRKLCSPIDPRLIEEVKEDRPDLAGILGSVNLYKVPKGSLEPFRGWHHWEFEKGTPKTIDIFIEDEHPEEETKYILVHELCHSRVMQLYPKIYPDLSEESKEALVRRCERGEI